MKALKDIESSSAFSGQRTLVLEDARVNKRGIRRIVSYTWGMRILFIAHLLFGFAVVRDYDHLWPIEHGPKYQVPEAPPQAPGLPSSKG